MERGGLSDTDNWIARVNGREDEKVSVSYIYMLYRYCTKLGRTVRILCIVRLVGSYVYYRITTWYCKVNYASTEFLLLLLGEFASHSTFLNVRMVRSATKTSSEYVKPALLMQ